jgi:hypothetical protein
VDLDYYYSKDNVFKEALSLLNGRESSLLKSNNNDNSEENDQNMINWIILQVKIIIKK